MGMISQAARIHGDPTEVLSWSAPYSPEFNPIERLWSKLKTHLRRIAARTQEALDVAITEAAGLITASDATNWIRGAGYTHTPTR